ncbi:hypothetical protein J6590_083027 [Homalodisca vitripennis]|nr:hypothetical protein J6590_083027 [Homalodisca vitripennis]
MDDLCVFTGKINALVNENELLKEEVRDLRRQQSTITSKVLDLESRSRRNNLIFKGLEVNDKTADCRHVVQQFCSKMFGTSDKMWINRSHPLGRNRAVIIAYIPDDQDIHYIMSRVKCLKGTSYVIHKDYPQQVRDKRARLVKLRHEVERVTGRRKFPLYHDHLTIDGIKFSWTAGKLISGHLDGAKRLSELQDTTSLIPDQARRSQRTPSPGAVTTLQANSNHRR